MDHTAKTAPGRRTDLKCADCGSPMALRDSKHGLFYGCVTFPQCRGTHGAHPNGAPLGTPADRATKDARMEAHAAFDTLWKGGRMSKGAAYRWMQNAMGMTPAQAHIGKFTKAQCEQLVWYVKAGV